MFEELPKNKVKILKALSIFTIALEFRYGSINSSTTNLISNSTQQHTQMKVDGKVQEGLSHKSSSHLIKTGSGVLIGNKRIPEALKSALEIRSGQLGKPSSPGARAKADARRDFKAGKFSSGSTIIPGADALVTKNMYCRYQQNAPLSYKPTVKLEYNPFMDNGGHNTPPPDTSQYKGGPNPFLDKFDYDNPNHNRENIDFSSQKHMNHAYDRHAKECFGMKQNRNKENLKTFQEKTRSFIESPETEKINGSYRYEIPAYLYKEKSGDLVAIVNANDNSFVTIVNATQTQLKRIKENNNFGLDTRPPMYPTSRTKNNY